jgi:uncharacterized cupredoxin-like copper-binding protein
MKTTLKTVAATMLVTTLLFTTTNLFAAGSGDHSHGHEEEEFDPVSNEFGSYEPGMKATKTIKIEMSDEMRFTPDVINVNVGDVIMFEHKNNGKLMHEFVLGTADSLDEHAEMMKKFPGMEHAEPYMTHVAPGEHGKIMWKFSEPGEFAFGCLIPGHYDAGMKGKVLVGS